MNKPDEASSIRAAYEQQGVEAFYQANGDSYRNPHEPAVRSALRAAVARWRPDLGAVLDLACGSGEATLALQELGGTVSGADPYTFRAYQERTGQPAERWSFEEIAVGALDGRRYTLIVCSFALHLLAPSWLPGLCFQLARISPALLVLTPHKRPVLRPEWGWHTEDELVVDRVRARWHTTAF